MFLRKLTVIFVPLLLLAALCLLVPALDSLQLLFFAPVVKGVLMGVALALMLPLAGATRSREPFAGLLWVPALLTLALLAWQFVASTGVSVPVLDILRTSSQEVVLVEAAFCGYLMTQCLRTARKY